MSPCFSFSASALLWAALVLAAAPAAWAREPGPPGPVGQPGPVVEGPVECGQGLPLDDRMHCENVRLDAADAALNDVYGRLSALLDERGRRTLKEAQQAWLAFRDRDFELRSAIRASQGQEGLLAQILFLRSLTEARTVELEALAQTAREQALASAAAAAALSPSPSPSPLPEAETSPPAGPDLSAAAPVRASSPQALDRLLGEHALRLHWLGEGATGLARVEAQGGVVVFTGSQELPDGFLRILGWVEAVDEDSFVLRGEIWTRVAHLADGRPCVRRGRMVFARHKGRPFWRLQSQTNPCARVTDYIDVFLSGSGE